MFSDLPTSETTTKQERELSSTAPPIRTKSYFQALQKDLTDFQETKKLEERVTSNRQLPGTQNENRRVSGKVVSVSSVEIPITQPSRTVIVDRTPSIEKRSEITHKTSVFPTEKDLFFQKKPSPSDPPSYAILPPSYEETIESRSNSLSDSSSKPSLSKKEEFRLSDTDLLRTMSTSSRFSVDSLMMSPDAMPFERDAFGRLSMSERKGRAHLDATKSDFFSKMKKYKSMEDISFSKLKLVYSLNLPKALSFRLWLSLDTNVSLISHFYPLGHHVGPVALWGIFFPHLARRKESQIRGLNN